MNELKTLQEYTIDAKKIIRHRLGHSRRWMTDDNIGAVVNQLVYADKEYDSSKGSLNNFRYHSAMLAIKRIVAKKKHNPISLYHTFNFNGTDSDDFNCELHEVIPDRKQTPIEDEFVDIQEILNHDCLTDLEKFYLKEYYVAGKKQVQIAKERGVTNRAISFTILEAIKKLKKAYNVKD